MGSFLQGISLLLNAIILGLLAGLFEETARYILFKFILPKARTWREGILVGLGHGGAEAVKSYLVSKGVEARRLAAVGKGEANPVVQCDDKDRQALIACLEPNRRVEVEEITVTRPAR